MALDWQQQNSDRRTSPSSFALRLRLYNKVCATCATSLHACTYMRVYTHVEHIALQLIPHVIVSYWKQASAGALVPMGLRLCPSQCKERACICLAAPMWSARLHWCWLTRQGDLFRRIPDVSTDRHRKHCCRSNSSIVLHLLVLSFFLSCGRLCCCVGFQDTL
jgi:hypothetical protein